MSTLVHPGERGGSTIGDEGGGLTIGGSFCDVQNGASNRRVGKVDDCADAETPGDTAAAAVAVGGRSRNDCTYERASFFAVVNA